MIGFWRFEDGGRGLSISGIFMEYRMKRYAGYVRGKAK